MIVVIAHIKGGTGKTTTAVQLALQRQISCPEKKIWLIDTDEQQSALDTISIRADQEQKPALECSAYTTARALTAQLNAQSELFDDIIIDCGGHDSEALRAALMACDKLIIPVLPRAYDLWSLSKLEPIIESAKSLGASFETRTLLNQKDRSADCREAISYLKQNENFQMLNSSLSARLAFSKACGTGKAVCEIKPKDRKACDELKSLEKEIFK